MSAGGGNGRRVAARLRASHVVPPCPAARPLPGLPRRPSPAPGAWRSCRGDAPAAPQVSPAGEAAAAPGRGRSGAGALCKGRGAAAGVGAGGEGAGRGRLWVWGRPSGSGLTPRTAPGVCRAARREAPCPRGSRRSWQSHSCTESCERGSGAGRGAYRLFSMGEVECVSQGRSRWYVVLSCFPAVGDHRLGEARDGVCINERLQRVVGDLHDRCFFFLKRTFV